MRSALLATLATILAGLAGRAALDKLLALEGGTELVAAWAQYSSVIELVSGVALAGLGTGISVMVAQCANHDAQRGLLAASLRLALAVSGVALAATALAGLLNPGLLAGEYGSGALVVLAGLAGWLAVIAGIVNGYWVGQRQRGRMLALAAVSAALPVVAVIATPPGWVLAACIAAHAIPALALAAWVPWRRVSLTPESLHALRRFIPAGLSVGILSPGSMIVARAVISAQASWHDAGLWQALWRATDWIASIAGGVLMLLFLPRLSAAAGTPRFRRVASQAALATLLPSAVAFGVLFAFHREFIAMLYDTRFEIDDAAVALFAAGSLARIASWVGLAALYALHRTRLIAVGELLSLPLFALLLAAWPAPLTLASISAAWLVAFVAYAAFNAVASFRGPQHDNRV